MSIGYIAYANMDGGKELLLDSVVNYRYTIINGKVVVIDYKGILPFIKIKEDQYGNQN
jgi:hypothetical protein